MYFSSRIRSFYREQRRILARNSKKALLALVLLSLFGYYQFFTYYEEDPPYSEQNLDSETQQTFFDGCVDTEQYMADASYRKMNATFVMLTRNEELEDVLSTILQLEARFNQWYQYPYVFLNDVPFSDDFKSRVVTSTRSKVEFGTLNELEWEFPEKVRNSALFKESLASQMDRGILYGDQESYHKMCRFYSGMFYKHPLVKQYEWYWRIEPDVDFYCDITYDPFFEMHMAGKQYGFTVIIPELYWSVPNLFRYTQAFLRENGWPRLGSLWKLFTYNMNIMDTSDPAISQWVHLEEQVDAKLREKVIIDLYREGRYKNEDAALETLINRAQSKVPIFEDKFNNEEQNMCHFWSNFEIAKISVFENDVYNAYFEYLESSDGFWRERWGDAPVHSLGLALTLDVEDVHYFRDIGYRHSTLQHCPKNADTPYEYFAKETRFERTGKGARYDKPTDYGVGCRCQCNNKKQDIEDTSYPCMDIWLELAHQMHPEANFDGKYYPRVNAAQIEEQLRQSL
ncbi:putative mannosyltransferase KNAG_0A05330, partial [Huiozyma naganishii CBS 8797]